MCIDSINNGLRPLYRLTIARTLIMIRDKCANEDSITYMLAENNNQMFKNESEKMLSSIAEACGNTFHANRPDDVYGFSSVYPCWKYDWVEQSYQCSTCIKNTKLFWHPQVHKHHGYATVEEIERKTTKDTVGNHPDCMRRMVRY